MADTDIPADTDAVKAQRSDSDLSYVQIVRDRDAKVGMVKPSVIRLAIIELSDRLAALEKDKAQ